RQRGRGREGSWQCSWNLRTGAPVRRRGPHCPWPRRRRAKIARCARPRSDSDQSVDVEEAAELLGARRVAQLAQRLGLDLADPLAGDVELLADLFEGVVGVHVD